MEKWSDITSNETGSAALCDMVLKLLAKSLWFDLDMVFKKTESPIERIMLFGLYNALWSWNHNVKFRIDGREFGVMDNPNHFVIEPQARIGQFRVDFLIEHTAQKIVGDEGDFENDPDNVKFIYATVISKLIVECDGHDFHEKTKVQAQKDKSRDRMLKMCGYDVFHFTGSEIWRDDKGECANSVKEYFIQQLYPNLPKS